MSQINPVTSNEIPGPGITSARPLQTQIKGVKGEAATWGIHRLRGFPLGALQIKDPGSILDNRTRIKSLLAAKQKRHLQNSKDGKQTKQNACKWRNFQAENLRTTQTNEGFLSKAEPYLWSYHTWDHSAIGKWKPSCHLGQEQNSANLAAILQLRP